MVLFSVRASRNGGATRGSQNGSARAPAHGSVTQSMPMMPVLPAGAPGAVSGPTTNLNIGMDYWGAPAIAPMRGKVHNTPGVLVSPGQSIPSELRLQVLSLFFSFLLCDVFFVDFF